MDYGTLLVVEQQLEDLETAWRVGLVVDRSVTYGELYHDAYADLGVRP